MDKVAQIKTIMHRTLLLDFPDTASTGKANSANLRLHDTDF